MNKLAYAAAAVVALLIVGLPPVVGRITEAQVRARVADLAQSGVWTAEVRSFERGWFRGRAKIDLGLSPDYLANLQTANTARGMPFGTLLGESAPLDVVFAYGPIAILDGAHFGLSKMVATLDPDSAAVASLQQSLGVAHLFEFRGRTGFLGKIAFDADVPPIDLPMAETRVRFSGALIDGTFAGDHLVANGRIDRFEFSSPTGVFTVESVLGRIDNEIRSQYVLPGTAGFSIAKISIVDAARSASPVFDAADLHVDSVVSLDESKNLLGVQATYTLESAFVDGTQIVDASLGMAFRNLDVAALETYGATLRGLAVNTDPGAALRELGPAIERALAAGPSVTLDPVRFTFNGEMFTARLEIVTNTAALPAAGALDLEDPATLLALFDSAADVEVSKTLAQQMAALAMRMQYANDAGVPPEQLKFLVEAQSGLLLVALVGQGILTDTGERYRAELRVEGGVMTMNGTQLPFSVP